MGDRSSRSLSEFDRENHDLILFARSIYENLYQAKESSLDSVKSILELQSDIPSSVFSEPATNRSTFPKATLKFFQILPRCDQRCHGHPHDASNRTFTVVAVGETVGTVDVSSALQPAKPPCRIPIDGSVKVDRGSRHSHANEDLL